MPRGDEDNLRLLLGPEWMRLLLEINQTPRGTGENLTIGGIWDMSTEAPKHQAL